MTEETSPSTATQVPTELQDAIGKAVAEALAKGLANMPPPKAQDFAGMLPQLLADPKVQALQAASSKGSSVILEHVQALEENLAKTWEVMKHLRNLALITAPDSKKAEIEAEKKRFNEAYGKLAKPQ